jgi:hypothetical protein
MKKTLIVLTILASALSGARAGLVFSENFDYADGGIVSNSAGIWAINTGTPGSMLVSNNVLQVFANRTEDITHQLVPGYTNGGPVPQLYASMTVTFLTNSLPTLNGTYFTAFAAEQPSFYRCRVWAGSTNILLGNSAPAGSFYLGVGNNSPSTATPQGPTNGQLTSVLLTTNVTYTVVMRYAITNATSTIWVNTDPAAMTESGTHATADDFVDPTNFTSINFIGLRQSTGEGTILVDNLKVGTTFADVAGANTAPTISPIANQSLPMNGSTGPLPFTVQDAETSPGALTVTATSDNTALVPDGGTNIVIVSGDPHGNCTITINPLAGQQGSASITVNVSDSVNTSVMSFKVTVGAPSIGAIANQIVDVNTTTPAITFSVSDAESDAITLSKASSNPTLIPTSGIALGSSGSLSNVTITPALNQTGNATITIGASDGHSTNYTSFVVTVRPLLGVLYSEDFAYTNFDAGIPNGLYGAVGGSGGPWSHVSGTGYELQVTNGLAFIVSTNGEDLGAPLIGSATYYGSNGVVLYTSFTVNFSYLPSNAGEYFFHLSSSANDTSSFRDKVFANKAGAPTGKFRLAVANIANSPVQFSRDLMLGATYAVVTRYNAGTGDTVLWVNPVNEQNPGAAASDSPGSSTIGGVALRQAGCCTGDLAIGPMKVGTSFADVWAAPSQPHLDWMVDNGGNLVMSWANPLFVLQGAPEAAGPYTDLAPTSPYTNSISGQQFFRLRY